jgi:pyruvate formate lyase activating enzyme
LDLIGPYLDSFRVDIKGFSEESYRRIGHLDRFEGILEVTIRAQQKWGMHVEVVSNLIPGCNDDMDQLKNIAAWICRNLGKSTPWHVTRFVPHVDLSHRAWNTFIWGMSMDTLPRIPIVPGVGVSLFEGVDSSS